MPPPDGSVVDSPNQVSTPAMGSLYRTLTGQSQKSHRSHLSDGSSKAQPVLTKTTTTDPLSGVLNHLTEAQGHNLVEFKELLHKDGWWTPEGPNGKPSHDDGTLLRYLRARKFDVKGAYGQFTDTEKWLKEQRVEELYEHFDVDHYERARLMYPQWTGHRDRRGIPIYVYVIKGLDGKNVSKYQKESQHYKDSLPNHKKLSTPAKLIPLFALYHNLLNFVLPFVSTLERPNPEIPVTNSTNIVDISGVGLTQFWNLKGHMQDASVLATAHYPETLDRIFIIGAPAFFPTVWGWIKRWFDPVTVSKIFILSKHEVRPTLEKFMDLKDVPKRYGGALDWEWGQLPHLDDETRAALETDGNKGWIRGPALWLNHQRVPVGSEKGKLRRPDAEIEKLKPVVYAADGTEEPVHPGEKDTTAVNGALKASNGAAVPPSPMKRLSSHHAVTAAQAATSAAAVTTAAATSEAIERRRSESNPKPVTHSTTPHSDSTAAAASAMTAPDPNPATANSDSTAAATSAMTTSNSRGGAPEVKQDNVRSAPIDGAPLNLPDHQPGFPETTAEYIHDPDNSAKTNDDAASAPPSTNSAAHSTNSTAPASTTSALPSTRNTSITPSFPKTESPHPPSQPAPGPHSTHENELTRAIAAKLEGESLSTIPSNANGTASGDIPHPEVVVTSDRSKGLAIEAAKLEGIKGGSTSGVGPGGRPGMERFVTAAEVPLESTARA